MREYKFQAYDKLGTYTDDGNPGILHDITGKTYLDHVWHDEDFIKRQWTGLNDANGKGIYEGDIVSIVHPYKERTYRGVVIYKKNRFEVDGFYFTHYDDPSDAFEDMQYIAVIGNIFENADLLPQAIDPTE